MIESELKAQLKKVDATLEKLNDDKNQIAVFKRNPDILSANDYLVMEQNKNQQKALLAQYNAQMSKAKQLLTFELKCNRDSEHLAHRKYVVAE